VDDMDLFHLDMQVNENVHQTHTHLQDAIINWGKLLIATSGAYRNLSNAPTILSCLGGSQMALGSMQIMLGIMTFLLVFH
jgi:hypothetical protein